MKVLSIHIKILSIPVLFLFMFTMSSAVLSYGETNQNIKVFNQRFSNKNNRAKTDVQIKIRNLNSVTANVTGFNGSPREYTKVKLVINNEKYFPIQNIAPQQRKRTTFQIPVAIIKNARGFLEVKCFVTNDNHQSKVTLSLTARYQDSLTYNPTNPGNNYDPHHPNNPGNSHDSHNPGYNPGSGYNYGLTAEDFIHRADEEFSYQKHDDILLAGARRLFSLRGILKLAGAANLQTTVDKIAKEIASSNRRFSDMPDYREIKQELSGLYWYSSHDNLLKSLSQKTDSVRVIIFMASLANLSEGANFIVNSLDNLGAYSAMDIPMYEDVKKVHSEIMWYNTADNMLVKVARFIKNPRMLAKMADLAHYYTSKKIIQKIRDEMYYGGSFDDDNYNSDGNHSDHHGNDYTHTPYNPGPGTNPYDPYDPYDPGYNNEPSTPPSGDTDPVYDDYFKTKSSELISGQSTQARGFDSKLQKVKKELPKIDQELYKAFLKESKADSVIFTPKDIENRNFENIATFLNGFKSGSIQKNKKSAEIIKKIKEMLLYESQNGSENAQELLSLFQK